MFSDEQGRTEGFVGPLSHRPSAAVTHVITRY